MPTKYYDSELLAGKKWDIKHIKKQAILFSRKTKYYEHSDGRLSFRMEKYEKKAISLEESNEEYTK